jgi:UDP-N-acetylmuramoyl-L-alanyl-D-glutamate--2,6-diaminopimelate ligase
MLLKDLLNELGPVSIEGPVDRDIVGIAYDSRRVTAGTLFVAIPGAHVDGHEYVPSAVDKGAVAVICERNGFLPQRATKIKVPDTREALAQVAAAFFQHPSARLKMIGVTGTNGKTTVCFLIKQILEAAGIKAGLIGTVRYEIGDRVIPAQRTTPEALEIQQMLAQMLRAGCQACVMEVSSHALDQKRVHGVEFDVGVFTNLTRDHLDYHGTMEAYFSAKRSLFVALEQGAKRGGAVLNIDDSFGKRLSQESNFPIRLTYGLSQSASIRATNIQLSERATQMTVQMEGRHFNCRLPLIGRHNLYNALAAIGAGIILGIDADLIQKALNSAVSAPGRLELIPSSLPFGVYVDYAHTDDALENVLRTLREITTGRLLVTFGCGGNRDKGKRPKMGKVAADLADFTIITSDNPRKESAAQIAQEIAEGFKSTGEDRFKIELDRRRAIHEIIGMAQTGDSILIAGKGHETYQEFEDTVVPFDDRVFADETLQSLRGQIPKPDYASRH